MELDIDALGEDVGLFDAIRSCRHIRRLQPDPVPKAHATFGSYKGNERMVWFREAY